MESEPFGKKEGRKSISTMSDMVLDSNMTLLKFCHTHTAKSPLEGKPAEAGLRFHRKRTITAVLHFPHLPLCWFCILLSPLSQPSHKSSLMDQLKYPTAPIPALENNQSST